VIVHVPIDGSYNSVLFRVLLLNPPATNTFPFVKTDTVCIDRAVFMKPVLDPPRKNVFNQQR
jgi:hypothetical protein